MVGHSALNVGIGYHLCSNGNLSCHCYSETWFSADVLTALIFLMASEKIWLCRIFC